MPFDTSSDSTVLAVLPSQGWEVITNSRNTVLCWLVRSNGQINPVVADHRGVTTEVPEGQAYRVELAEPTVTECGCTS